MIVFILFPILTILHAFVCMWLLRFFVAWHPAFKRKTLQFLLTLLYFTMFFSTYIATFITEGAIKRFIMLLCRTDLGLTIYSFMFVLPIALIRFIFSKSKNPRIKKLYCDKSLRIIGTICIISILFLCIWGRINAGIIRTTNYDVTINKDGNNFNDLNIVLVADLHMGYTIGPKHIEQMVNRINECDPDVVLIGGDIFDNEFTAIREPDKITEILKSIKTHYGVYAVYGNHDSEERIINGFTFEHNKKSRSPQMDQLLEDANIQLLNDNMVKISDSILIYGRPDYNRPNLGDSTRLEPNELSEKLDKNMPLIVLEHQPKQLDDLDALGIDLHLSGHTHKGQLFPLTLGIKKWQNPYGLLKLNNMTSIVTSGVGVYGPFMRIGSNPEICNIHVHFEG